MIRAIITDLDRTLLRTDKSISEYTKNVIERCHERGILVLAASARPPREIERYNEMLSFDAVTAMNGAIVRCPDGETRFTIPRESGERIIAELMRFDDIFLSIETSDGLYSNRDIPVWKPKIYKDFPHLPDNIELYKILVSSESEEIYRNIELCLTEDVYHTIANKVIIQIMSDGATKFKGVELMLSSFGVLPSEAVYFGDDHDDIGPIRACGVGVAMANSVSSVLEAADAVTDDNDNDGVAKYIENHILKGEK